MFARRLKAESSLVIWWLADYNRLLTNCGHDSWIQGCNSRSFIQFEERQSEIEESSLPSIASSITSILNILTTYPSASNPEEYAFAILSNYSTMAFVNRDKRRSWSDMNS